MIDELINLGRELSDLGYCPGGAGNVSFRRGEIVIITRSGVNLGELDETDFAHVRVNWRTGQIENDVQGASKELPMHLAMFARMREETGYIAHVHSQDGVAVSCLPAYSSETAIPPITPYFVMKVGNVPLIDYAEPGSLSQADKIKGLEGDFTTLLLQNHGLTSWGRNTKSVFSQINEAEITAGLWMQLYGKHAVRFLSHEEQRRLSENFPGAKLPKISTQGNVQNV